MARVMVAEGKIIGKMERDGNDHLEVVLRGVAGEPEVLGVAKITREDCRSYTVKIAPTGGVIIATLKKNGDSRAYVLVYKVLVRNGKKRKFLELMLQTTYLRKAWERKAPKRGK